MSSTLETEDYELEASSCFQGVCGGGGEGKEGREICLLCDFSVAPSE